jgi:hypothetical protein
MPANNLAALLDAEYRKDPDHTVKGFELDDASDIDGLLASQVLRILHVLRICHHCLFTEPDWIKIGHLIGTQDYLGRCLQWSTELATWKASRGNRGTPPAAPKLTTRKH